MFRCVQNFSKIPKTERHDIYYIENKNNLNNSFNSTKVKKSNNNIIKKKYSLPKKALNLTSITPLNKRFNTINTSRNNNDKIFKRKYFIKINNKIKINKKKPIIINSNKKEFSIKKLKNKNIIALLEKINNNTFNNKKNNNTIINQPGKSFLLARMNIAKNNPYINDNKKSINLKFNKNISLNEKINNSNTLRSSYRKAKIKKENNRLIFKYKKKFYLYIYL